jgi:hypothetical protein
MADIALSNTNTNQVRLLDPSVLQHTGIAAETIAGGAPVLFDTNGKYINADANGSGTVACFGVSTHPVVAGQALTAIRVGLMDGWALAGLDYGALVYVSNTAGALADAAGSTSIAIGQVVPIFGTGTNQTADKALLIQCTGSGKSA